MLTRRSIYMLNKLDPDAIVCPDADGHLIRLTREDFATEAEFLVWKAWSDENYHAEEKRDHLQANHSLPLEILSEQAASSEGPEFTVQESMDERQREKLIAEAVVRIREELTETQFRRLWMYCAEGLKEEEIARREGCTHQGISKSINAALKKILHKFLF